MTDPQTTKMLQAILNGQSATNERIDKLDRKVDTLGTELKTEIKGVEKKLTEVEKRLTKRIDKIGTQLAYLEDDTPTREEFDKSERRVDRIDQKVIPQNS